MMDEICGAVGATGAVLLQSDIRTAEVPCTGGVAELTREYFRDNWHVQDIRAAKAVPLLLGGASVVIDEDFLTPEILRRDGQYNELLPRHGFGWFAVIGFRAGDAHWGLSIQRSRREGLFTQCDKQLLAPLARYMTEAATLSAAVGRVALTSATNALSAVDRAAIAVDRFGL